MELDLKERLRCLNIDIELVTDDGYGSQYVEPERICVQEDGTITVTVRAWRD